jgi:hypothetical protein
MVLMNAVSGAGIGTQMTVEAGPMWLATPTPHGTYYYQSGHVRLRTFGSEQPRISGGVFVPSDASKPASLFWEDLGSRTEVKASSAPQLEKKALESIAKEPFFTSELVYSGVSQGTVSILYREYKADFARPAFSQELKYDLKDGNEIGFRGARIKILKADNVSIKYVVTNPLASEGISNMPK